MKEFLRGGLGQAAQFVADRADLCVLLSSREDVQRGNLYAWLPVANYPARLVEALVLARDIGAFDLESRIREQLKQGPIRVSLGRSLDVPDRFIDFLAEAKEWASRYSRVLGFDIPI